ncbi:VirB8/TrbF family protein [Magnetospira sp. QH-2]|uniref:VirB8/TrbF family protein n=1 Tax=Magnetospira sp. (strain QH-2) TaxID=1288970 RepID=UPI0003E80B9D|nr:VirB8/TrbF family protein [Magnetospira sp. QH-2]CCQ75756.1 Putative type IV secretion system protein virB8 [Magnetospira sp. QH-2]
MLLNRRKKAKDPPPVDDFYSDGPKSETATVRAPKAADFDLAHRRVVFLLRGAVAVIVVLLFIVAILASTLRGLMPLKEIQLGLLRMDDPTSRVVWVEPVRKSVPGVELFTEAHIKRFLVNSQTIDGVSETERFQEAVWQSHPSIWERFRRERIANGAIQKAIDSGLVRSVSVHVVQKIESMTREVDKYRAEFTMVDRIKGQEVERKLVEAIVGIAYNPKEVSLEHRYMNPLGVQVVGFSMRFKENQNQEKE